jgi:inosose dehydratase
MMIRHAFPLSSEFPMSLITRREWLASASAVVATGVPVFARPATKLPLGFSLYGMRSLALADALKVCRDCGYDGVELAAMPGYHADPEKLTADDRKQLQKRLADSGLSVLGIMENLPALGNAAIHKANLDRLKAAAELAATLCPDGPPVIETVLGGKPADWDKVKGTLAERLVEWAKVGQAGKVVIAVKPHVANAMHTIAGATWLLKQVDSPWLRLAFDYSHFELRGVKMNDAVSGLLPHSVFVHVKDARGTPEKFEFLLPGEGSTEYAALAKQFTESKYAGPVVVEVSGMVSGKPGYDAAAAAKKCYRALNPVFGQRARD